MPEEKEEYKSIFDAASKIERKKALDKALSEVKEEAGVSKEKRPALTREEMAERFEQCRKLHNLIADKLEEVFVKNNLTPRMLHDYFETSRNFTQNQWRLIEEQKDVVQEMLTKLVPEPIKKGKVEKSEAEKAKEKRPTKMQVKSRWMPMR